MKKFFAIFDRLNRQIMESADDRVAGYHDRSWCLLGISFWATFVFVCSLWCLVRAIALIWFPLPLATPYLWVTIIGAITCLPVVLRQIWLFDSAMWHLINRGEST